MTLYQYRCPGCQRVFNTEVRADAYRCERCTANATRIWDFQARASMAEHWNTAAGQYVSNEREFRDALKRKGDEVSERLGLHHEFVPLTPAEMHDPSAASIPLDSMSPTIARDAGLT